MGSSSKNKGKGTLGLGAGAPAAPHWETPKAPPGMRQGAGQNWVVPQAPVQQRQQLAMQMDPNIQAALQAQYGRGNRWAEGGPGRGGNYGSSGRGW